MTIILTQPIYEYGAEIPAGTILTRNQDVESDLVGRKIANRTNQSTSARPVLLGFGCSISQMDQDLPQATTTTVSGEHKSGSTTILVASGAGFTNGDKVAIPLYDGRLWKTTITVSSNTLTPAAPVPKLIRAGATVTKYTNPVTADLNRPINIVGGAVQLLGGTVEMVGGYGYGGATAVQMAADFLTWFRYYQPAICTFHWFENDLATSEAGINTLAQIKAVALWAARYCLQNRCIPVVFSSVPFGSIASNRAAAFDEILRWVLNDLPVLAPGTIGADASTKWLDTSNPTWPRSPIAGWTDGVHPNVDHRWAVAKLAGVPAIRDVLPSSGTLIDYQIAPRGNALLEGSGGSNSNLAGGSVVPAGYTGSRFGSIATITSTRDAGGGLKILASWPAGSARERNTDYGFFRYPFTFPTSWAGSGQSFRGYARLKITKCSAQINNFYPQVVMTGGETYNGTSGHGSAVSYEQSNDYIVMETPTFTIGSAQTIMTIGFLFNPVTNASPAEVALFECSILELGLLPVVTPMPI